MVMIKNDHLRLEIRKWMAAEGIQDIPEDWNRSKPVFQLSDTLSNICVVMYAGILELRKRHSETEYVEQWLNYPFPSDQFKMLEQAVSNME